MMLEKVLDGVDTVGRGHSRDNVVDGEAGGDVVELHFI